MRKIILTFLFFLVAIIIACAQQKMQCDCSIVLNEIIEDIETKYPGYSSKTRESNKVLYDKLKSDISILAKKNPKREDCFYLIEKYLAFFKDNHLIFTDRLSEPTQIHRKSTIDVLKDQLTGVWRRNSDSLIIEITRKRTKQQAYLASILNAKGNFSKKGAIHFELIGNENEFSIRKYNGALTTDLLRGRRLGNLLIEPNGIWEKQIVNKSNPVIKPSEFDVNVKFQHKQINHHIYYLGIPSFSMNPKGFDSLIVNIVVPQLMNNKLEHLIIDLRNNVGGNSSFLSLLRLLYDKPFAVPGDFVFATPQMIARYKASANPVHQTMLPKLITNVGGFVQRDSLKLSLKQTYLYPKTVSILVNENSASSTEYFLLLAKHSAKVKIFGRHTAGTLDYIELLEPEKLSCEGYSYMRPTVKSFFTDDNPIDNKGVLPDVDLSKYPDNKWVEIVIGHLNKSIDNQ